MGEAPQDQYPRQVNSDGRRGAETSAAINREEPWFPTAPTAGAEERGRGNQRARGSGMQRERESMGSPAAEGKKETGLAFTGEERDIGLFFFVRRVGRETEGERTHRSDRFDRLMPSAASC